MFTRTLPAAGWWNLYRRVGCKRSNSDQPVLLELRFFCEFRRFRIEGPPHRLVAVPDVRVSFRLLPFYSHKGAAILNHLPNLRIGPSVTFTGHVTAATIWNGAGIIWTCQLGYFQPTSDQFYGTGTDAGAAVCPLDPSACDQLEALPHVACADMCGV